MTRFLRELSKIEDMAKSLKEKELHSSSPTAFLIRTPLVKEVESKISKLSLAIAVDMDVAMVSYLQMVRRSPCSHPSVFTGHLHISFLNLLPMSFRIFRDAPKGFEY
jgi:hypothetical protein